MDPVAQMRTASKDLGRKKGKLTEEEETLMKIPSLRDMRILLWVYLTGERVSVNVEKKGRVILF
jgi:hypothetical protein